MGQLSFMTPWGLAVGWARVAGWAMAGKGYGRKLVLPGRGGTESDCNKGAMSG